MEVILEIENKIDASTHRRPTEPIAGISVLQIQETNDDTAHVHSQIHVHR